MDRYATEWSNTSQSAGRPYRCGYCGLTVSADRGWGGPLTQRRNEGFVSVRLCPHCNRPTFFDAYRDTQTPGPPYGGDVEAVPGAVYGLYGEARRAMTPGAFTAAALVLRKLLMNIAVAEGADTDRNFVGYVDYLEEHHYSPPKGRAWVDHIRRKGNEATHEIPDITREDAEELLAFAETLLKYLYEFPSRVAPDAEPTE